MRTSLRVSLLSSVVFLCATTGNAQAQQPPAVSPSVWAAPAQPQAAQTNSAFQSACGNQPMCYDAPDFAVAVVDFRMSLASGYKLMDATLRFVNKTSQPLILGYLDGSAVALDDQGNRYAPYGNRGLAGIGLVNGNSADPKFVLQPGGAGDARWELLWRPGAQDPIGSAFDLSMTIREVNTLVGGQHALGGEIPLRFQGLANGMVASGVAPAAGAAGAAGASPMLAGGTSGLPACGPSGNASGTMTAVAGAANSVGGQQTANATNTATNTAGNAMSQLAGLKSIFGKKNAAAPATSASGANCIPTATANAMPAAVGTSTAPAAAGQAVTTAPTAVAPVAAAPGGVAPAAVPAAVPATAGKPAANARVTNAVATRGVVPATAVKTSAPQTGNAAAPSAAAAKPAATNAKPAAPPAAPAAAPAKKPAAPAPAKKPATTTTSPSQ